MPESQTNNQTPTLPWDAETRLLLAKARKAEAVLDTISEAVITLDRNFRITYVNAEAARINKKPAEAFLGRLHAEEWPASVGTEFERQFHRAMTERVSVHFLERYYVPGEYDDWIEVTAYPAADEDGGGLHLIYRDVTAAKQQEAALQQRTEALRASEEQLRQARARLESALSAGQIGAWTWDLVNERIVADERLALLFSLKREDAAGGRREAYFEAIHPEDRPRVIDAIDRAVTGDDEYRVEYRVVLPDGAHRWLSARGRVERDTEGRAVSLLGVITDITERVQRERREHFLSELTAYTRGLLDPDEVLYETAKAVGEFVDAHRCMYIEIDVETDTLTVRRDFVRVDEGATSMAGTHPLPAFGPLIVESLRAGNVTQIEDTETDPRLGSEHRETFRATNFRSFLSVPLHKAGKWVAVLAVHFGQPRVWTPDEAELLTAVTERTWLAVENARLFRETQLRAERETLLNRIGAAVRATLEPEAILQAAVSALGEGLQADRCYFVRYDQTRDTARVFPEWFRREAGIEPLAGRTLQMSSFSVDRDPQFKAGQTHRVEDAIAYSPDEAAPLLAVNVRAILRVPIAVGDQMTAIAVAMAHQPRRWTDDEMSLVENVATLVRSALESAYVQQRERTIAQQLQAALQPPPPPDVPGLTLGGFYRPALAEAGVGGDFYDVFALEKGRTALVVGDLSGKGLHAASAVATIRNMTRFALYNCPAVAAAITTLNHTLVEHRLLEGFATLFVGVYDSARRTLTYVNCGQEPGLIFRAATGKIEQLPPTGPVLGGFESANGYAEEMLALSAQDVLALFTDGLTEVGPSRKDLLNVEGVSELLRGHCAALATSEQARSPQPLINALITGVDAFAVGGLRDDIALLVGVVTPA